MLEKNGFALESVRPDAARKGDERCHVFLYVRHREAWARGEVG